MSPVVVPLLEPWRKRADAYAEKARFPSMKTGKLAEYAVIDYFRKNSVFVREDQTPVNRPDYFDINFGSALADVKSCLEPAKELRVTKSLFDTGRRFAFYIGVQMSRDRQTAKIFGYCTKDDVSKAKFKKIGTRVAYVIPFSKLEPIEKLVNAFRKNE